MKRFLLAATLVTLLAALAVAQASKKRVAVLDFRVTERAVTSAEGNYLTDMVRTAARKALPSAGFIIMTKENIYEMLPPDKRDLAKCEGQCEVETGRMIGADYLVTGDVVNFAGEPRLTVRLYETETGDLVESQVVSGKTVRALEAPVQALSGTLFAAVPGARVVQTPPSMPPPVPGTTPPPSTATVDPEYEKLVQAERARIEAQKRLDAEKKAKLEAAFAQVKRIHDDGSLPAGAKKPAYEKFLREWPGDATYRPQVEAWLRSGTALEGMVLIPAGTFAMGSPSSEPGRYDNEVQHQVTLTQAFYLGKTEVTQRQWKAVMGSNPSGFKKCGDDCPVEQVSWTEGVEFCNKLSDREGLTRCYSGRGSNIAWDKNCSGYRLPTEAEWEYAARAGTATAVYTGPLTIRGANNGPELDGIAWYGGNSGVSYSDGDDCSDWGEKQYSSSACGTHPVAKKAPNPWGLYDMIGNVWEWTWDWYEAYARSPTTDPAGPVGGSLRVYRGGSWNYYARFCRSALRGPVGPGYRYSNLGLRLARSAR